MKAIYDFQTIQIELTNACVHQCSNCTRFCGHHKKPFFMDWDTFKRAVDTMKTWPRRIGIMGGEPTLHPEFARYVEYASSVHPPHYDIGGGVKPVASLSRYIEDVNAVKGSQVNKLHGLGLWSSVCKTYAMHYETIQDHFIFQCVNDHTASSRHQAWLMTRKEFNISDSEWVKMRDNCWWQQWLGSPSVTPKGAFFCEVAAAMDILFDGPGGWKIEKDWWKRTPEDYKSQLMWCEYCSGAFCDLERDANEEVDDVSPLMYEKLKAIGSTKVKSNRVKLHTPGDGSVSIHPRQEVLLYQPEFALRVTEQNKHINPDAYQLISGEALGRKLYALGNCGWVLYSENEAFTPPAVFQDVFTGTVFNPGTLHYLTQFNVWLFNTGAKALKSIGMDGVFYIKTINELAAAWNPQKVVRLEAGFEEKINPDIEEWRSNVTQNGLMFHYQLEGEFNTVAYRSTVFVELEKIAASDCDFADKMRRLSAVSIDYVISSTLTSRFKTTIHNCLAQYLRKNDLALEAVKTKIASEAGNYCAYYALAMLEKGQAKKQALFQCILDPENKIALGLCALWDDIHSANEPAMSIMEELITVLKRKPVLLGNRYVGKSIQMIAAHAGMLPAGFADDERHGTVYGGTMTYSVEDALTYFADSPFLMASGGATARRLRKALKEASYSEEIMELHPLTFIEMKGSGNFDADFLKRLHELSASPDVGPEKLQAFLKENL